MPPIELDWPADSPVVVACSGGSDSLALLTLLRQQGRNLLVAHLDHAGRPDSHEPADKLEKLCQDWGLPFFRRRLQVERWARRYRMSWEAAARELRYHWLRGLARERGAIVVTAHTLDDQAETLLLRLVQGTTLTGLAGIHPRASDLARPLLKWTRLQLQDELRAQGLDWFEDPGNRDPRFPRVRLRHEVLPLLEQLNSGVRAHLARLAEDALELRAMLRKPVALLDMSRLQFEDFFHERWRELGPPPGVRFQRGLAGEVHAALRCNQWRSWNLPGDFWVEWDGQRLSLGRSRTLPVAAPPGCIWRFREGGERWRDRSLKKMLPAWGVPRRGRDQLPLLVRPPHEVLAVLGFAEEPEVAAWVPQERSGLLIVEAARRDEQATD